MKVLDFWKRQPPVVVAPAAEPSERATYSVEEMVEGVQWRCDPKNRAEVEIAIALYSARQLGRIAEELTRLRTHQTRLQLVELPPSVDAVDPHVADPGTPSTRV